MSKVDLMRFVKEGDYVPFERWKEAPKFIYDMAMQSVNNNVPTAMVFNEDLGWSVVQTGQGPFVAFSEEYEKMRKDIIKDITALQMNPVYVVGPRDPVPEDAVVINTTSKSRSYTKYLSPFYAGPVNLYGKYASHNVENAWQFSKLYKPYADENGEPRSEYWKWAIEGWNDRWAHRYPMGKGKKPLCSWWDGEALSYIEARKRIYIPVYTQAIINSPAFFALRQKRMESPIALWDFDGYRHDLLNMSLDDVVNDPKRKMGHAFVLKMLLGN